MGIFSKCKCEDESVDFTMEDYPYKFDTYLVHHGYGILNIGCKSCKNEQNIYCSNAVIYNQQIESGD